MKREIVLLLLSSMLCCQSLAQPTARSYDPESLVWQIMDAQTHHSLTEQASLAEELKIPSVEGCNALSAVHLRLDGVYDSGFVRMQCAWDLNLVFSQQTERGWSYLQTVNIGNKYEEARITVESVTGDNSQQVVVHKAQYESGTGIKQQNFVVYKLIDGRVKPILNVVESAWLTPPWTQHEISQESRFEFHAPERELAKHVNAVPEFDETQVLDFAGLRVELKREHVWSRESQMFLASQWYSARSLRSVRPLDQQ